MRPTNLFPIVLSLLLPAAAHAVGPTHVSGTISTNTTWTLANSPYVLDGAVTVAAGVTLTIEPGVVVKSSIGWDRRLDVNGTLNADARGGARIYFTSLYDDTVAGDTNGDGTASHASPGNWAGVGLRASGSSGTLGNVEIRCGGAWDWSASATTSLYVAASAVTVDASRVTSSAGDGLVVGAATTPAITGNVFADNASWPLRTASINSTQNVHNNSASGNRYGGMHVGSANQTLSVDLTWDQAMPYVGDTITIPAGRTLTIAPGTIYKSTIGWDRRFEVSGTLIAGQAAPAARTSLTSWYDDTIGGDTNGDGTATSAVAGNWTGIAYRSGSSGSLTNVDLAYGGAWDWSAGAYSELFVVSSSVTVAGSTVRKSSSRGIWIDTNATPDIGTSSIVENGTEGIHIVGGAAPVHDNTISANGTYAMAIAGANGTAGLARNTGTGNGYQAIAVAGTLSRNATWENAFPWVIDGTVVVNAGATLTLSPGVVVKATGGWDRYFNVLGTLSVPGTPAQHVTFTSVRDDTIAGDTNGDGTTTQPARGNWSGACFRSGSAGTLAYADFRWGGAYDYSTGYTASIYDVSSAVTLDHVTIGQSLGNGLVVDGGATPTLTNDTFTNIASWPLFFTSPNSTSGTMTGNAASSCGVNGAHVAGTLGVNARWSDSLVYVVDSFLVAAGVTLTIDPGRIVKFTNSWDRRVDVSGTLRATGTSGSPIVFTALADDTIGGDTNADGTASSPAAGTWAGIGFRAASASNQLTYAEVRYGGLWDWSAGFPTAVYVASSSTVIDHVAVKNSSTLGIYVDASTKPQLTYDTLTNHGGWAIRLADIDSANANMHDNASTGTGNGIYIPSTTLEGTATLAEALPYVCDYVNVSATGALTVNPGTVVKFTSGWDRRLEVSGTLTAGQAEGAKTYFTSWKDDTLGGDVNGDGTATSPAAGDWAGLGFRAGAGSVLTNVEVRYGGAWDWSLGGYAALAVQAGSPRFSGLTVSDSNGYGIYFYGGSPDVGACNVVRSSNRDIGFAANTTNTPTIHDCSSIGSVWYLGNGPQATWTRNIFNSWGAKQSRVSAGDVGSITTPTNTFNAVTNATLEAWNGVITRDTTWYPGAGPIMAQGWVDVQGTDGADVLTTLTLAPGTVVRFVHNGAAGFRIGNGSATPGALVADALGSTRIVLGSTEPVPNPGWWQGITSSAAGRVSLRNVFIGYADYALTLQGTVPMLDTVQLDRSNVGIYFVNATTPATFNNVMTTNGAYGIIASNSVPVFRNSQLLGSAYGVRNDSPVSVVDARQNWWGDPSGPGPVGPGNGAKITTGVLYSDFQTAPADDGDGVPLHAGPTPNPCSCGNITNCDDNCALVPNPSQADHDCDGVGDACDTNPTLTVSSDPADLADYPTIEQAVNAAYQSGTTIEILPGLGPYHENVRADRYMQFHFLGRRGVNAVIVDGGGNPAFYVQNKVGSGPTVLSDLTLRGYDGVQALVDTTMTRMTFDQVSYRALDLNGGTHAVTDSDIGPLAGTGIAVAGGAAITADRITIHECTTAAVISAGATTISDSLLVAGLGGSDGVRTTAGTLALRFVTVGGNTGYGINSTGGTLSITDSIVYGNSAGDLHGVACSVLTRSDVGSVDCSGVNGNLHANPLFTADYHLHPTSPCLDAGTNPATYAGDPPYDRAGGPRLLDWDGDGIARTDWGAYEHANGALVPPEVTGVAWPLETRITWDVAAGAVKYHIYRDLVGNLSYSNYGACRDDLDVNLTDTQLDDAGLPAAGTGFFYLVQAENAAGHRGTLGLGTSAERSSYNACP